MIIVVGLAGALVMGVCSLHYIKTHGKSKRQQSYRLNDAPYLGRRFDDFHTLHSASVADTNSGASASSLRAAVYEFVRDRDTTRQNFLHQTAIEMDKYRAWDARATDDPEFRSCASKPRQRHKSVFAGVRSVGAYVGNLAKGSGHKCAMYRARDTYGRYADGLNVANLTNWLGAKYDPDARYFRQQMQRALMRDMLDSQRRLLTSKIQAFDAFKLTFLSEDSLPEVGEVVVSVRAEHERDCSQRRQIDQLLNAESLSLDALKHAFLQVQGIASDELPRVGVSSERASTELDRRLARFLIHDLPGDFTKARGVLFDMHRRACHLQE